MIETVSGYPGAGKTMFLTHRAMKDIKRGRNVFTNYPVKGAKKITFDDLIKYRFPENSLVIIDEAGRWFSSRKWAELPDEVFDLFTLHRHMRLDLLVGVQNFARMDKALREVVELVWWATNYPILPFFMYDGYYDAEMLGVKGESQKKLFIPKWTRAKKLYDTHIMSREVDKDVIPLIDWFPDLQARGVRAAFAAVAAHLQERLPGKKRIQNEKKVNKTVDNVDKTCYNEDNKTKGVG